MWVWVWACPWGGGGGLAAARGSEGGEGGEATARVRVVGERRRWSAPARVHFVSFSLYPLAFLVSSLASVPPAAARGVWRVACGVCDAGGL